MFYYLDFSLIQTDLIPNVHSTIRMNYGSFSVCKDLKFLSVSALY